MSNTKINYIAIKKYNDKKEDMHVFTSDGKETIYQVFDGEKNDKTSYANLIELAKQNGVEFSAAGLRKLRESNLIYYMSEEEFDLAYPAMKIGNEKQSSQQKRKTREEVARGSVAKDNGDIGQDVFDDKNSDLYSSQIEEIQHHNRETAIKQEEFSSSSEDSANTTEENVANSSISNEESNIKINYIAIKKYNDKREDMHVFTSDGKETIYHTFDGEKVDKASYANLKELAKQNGVEYSAAGLRKLRESNLIYYMSEEEFDLAYPAMKIGNEKQSSHQKRKTSEEVARSSVAKVEDDTDIFTRMTKEMSELEQQERQTKDNGDIGQDVFGNKNSNLYSSQIKEIKYHDSKSTVNQKEPENPNKPGSPSKDSTDTDINATTETNTSNISFIVLKRNEDGLCQNMQIFTTDGKDSTHSFDVGKLRQLAKQNGINYKEKDIMGLIEAKLVYSMDENEFYLAYPTMKKSNEIQAISRKGKAGIKDNTEGKRKESEEQKRYTESSEGTKKKSPDSKSIHSTFNKSKRSFSLFSRIGNFLSSIKEKMSLSKESRVPGIIMALAATIIAIGLAIFHTEKSNPTTISAKTVTEKNTGKKEQNTKNDRKSDKKKKATSSPTNSPSPTKESTIDNREISLVSEKVEIGGIDSYKGFKDALSNANISESKKKHMKKIFSWLNYFNDDFANKYANKKQGIKPAHKWNEVTVNYLLFNNIKQTEMNQLFDKSMFDSNQWYKSYKSGLLQDKQAYIVSDESLKVCRLIDSEKGQEFYKCYAKLLEKYKSLTKESKHTKEEVINTFNKLVREDFLKVNSKITSSKIAVLPIINAFAELSNEIDTYEKLTKEELKYVNERVKNEVISKLDEYGKGIIANQIACKNGFVESPYEELSYKELRNLAINELKSANNYNVEKENRDISEQKIYKQALKNGSSSAASADSDYESYYQSTEEIKESMKVYSSDSKKKKLTKEEDIALHGSTTKEEKVEEINEACADRIIEEMENGQFISEETGKDFVKKQR